MYAHLKKFKQTKITKSKDHPGLRIIISRSPASFSIKVYKGKYKIAEVYRSPYQRKFHGYYSPDENKIKEMASFELLAFDIIAAQEPVLLDEYQTAFRECLEKYPQPSSPIKAEV